jgi:lysyl-tRNA synthetase class 2
MNPSSPWWTPHRHADRRPLLLARNRIQAAIRGWLTGEGFTEVDPAALAISPGNEAHLHGFATEAIGNDGLPRQMYLHTSPEFAMKKLLAAGETGSTPSAMSGGTGSGGRCTRLSSRCWNGIGWARGMKS